jgi:hypothetical protein
MRGSSSWDLIVRRVSSLAGTVAMTQASMGAGRSEISNRPHTKAKPRGWPSLRVDRPLPGFRPAGRLGDLFAFVECAEDNDAALTSVEGRSKRLLPVDGFGSRVDRPWPPPVPRVRKAPAHLDHPSRARFRIPNNDRQQTANAIGDDFVVAAVLATWSFAAAALGERLGKRDDFAPGCQSREFTAHGGTLSSLRVEYPAPPRRGGSVTPSVLPDQFGLACV